jgi:hypothetical protein
VHCDIKSTQSISCCLPPEIANSSILGKDMGDASNSSKMERMSSFLPAIRGAPHREPLGFHTPRIRRK